MSDMSIWFVSIILFLPITVITCMVPWLVRRDIVFGITVPKANWGDEFFKELRSIYLKNVIIVGVLSFAVSIVLQYMMDTLIATYIVQGIMLLDLVLFFLLYIDNWKKVKEYKAEQSWDNISSDIVAVDTKDGGSKKSISPLWFLLYVLIIVATLFIGYALYENAPDSLPMKYDFDGTVTRVADKSVNIIYQMVGIQVLMLALFMFIFFMLKRSKRTLDPNNLEKTTLQNAKMRYWWSIFSVFGGLLMVLLFGFIVVSIFTVMNGIIVTAVSIGFTVLFLVGTMFIAVKVGQSGNRIDVNKPDNEKSSGMLNRKDDRHWKYGSFYYNPDDPAIFVEKRFGVGFTNNWARWQSYAFIIVIIAVIVISAVLTT